jgi:hypothetical protein
VAAGACHGPETGLSACIFFACGKKGYRFYPLRESKPQSGFDFAEFCFAKLQDPRARWLPQFRKYN